MATPPSTASTYDWAHDPANRTVSPPPGVDDLQSSSGGPPAVGDPPWAAPKPSLGLPAWVIVAIVALVLMALLIWLATLVGDRESQTTSIDTGVGLVDEGAMGDANGTVTDAAGNEVTDGTGVYDQPAAVGEHSLSWSLTGGGAVHLRATDIDTDAALPHADVQDVIQPGYRLVVMTAEVSYEGGGSIQAAEAIWVTGETATTTYTEISGLVPDPLSEAGELTDGQTVVVTVAFLIPERDIDTLQVTVQRPGGIPLYYGTAP